MSVARSLLTGSRLAISVVADKTGFADPTIDKAQQLMVHKDVRLLTVTGGAEVVKQAMKSGKRAVCAGPGNPPVVVDGAEAHEDWRIIVDLLQAAGDGLKRAVAVLAPHPDVLHAGYVQDAQKEYAEARATQAIVRREIGYLLPDLPLVVDPTHAATMAGLGRGAGRPGISAVVMTMSCLAICVAVNAACLA